MLFINCKRNIKEEDKRYKTISIKTKKNRTRKRKDTKKEDKR